MKNKILIIFFLLLHLYLTAQKNNNLSRFSIKELDSLSIIQNKPEIQLNYVLEMVKKGKRQMNNYDTAFAKILFKTGEIYQQLRDWKNAKYYLEKAIAIWSVKMPLNIYYANSLIGLANVNYEMGDFSMVEHFYKKAIEIFKIVAGEEHPDYAMCLNYLGTFYFDRGDYQAAEEYFIPALKIRKIVFGEEHQFTARSLSNLGKLYSIKGDFKSAEQYIKQALEIRKKVLGENHPTYAISLNDLGGLYLDKGDYKFAEQYIKQALEIRKKVLGENHPSYASSLNNLGVLYRNIDNYTTSEYYYKQALEIRKKVLGKDHPDYAMSLLNLGIVYADLNNFEAAELNFKEALRIIKKNMGEDHPNYSNCLSNLGVLLSKKKDYTSAEYYFKKSLLINKKTVGEEHPEYAMNLINIGNLFYDKGEYKSAEPYYLKALEINKLVLGEDHPIYDMSLINLGLLYVELVDFKASEVYFNRSLTTKKNNLSSMFSWLSEKGKVAYWQQENSYYEDLNSIAAKASFYPKIAELSYNCNLIAKGLLLETSKELEDAIINQKDSTTLKVYEELKSLKKLIINLVSTGSDKADIIQKYENEADSLDKILVSRVGEYAESKLKFKITWKDVQNTLNDNEVAIEFARYINEKDSQNYYMALVLRKDYEYPKLVKLGSEKEIEAISAASGFSELYKLIWEPIDSLMDSIKTVYYSPVAYLNNISFVALCGIGSEEVVSSTDNRRGNITKNKTKTKDCTYLSDRFTLHRLSTTRYLAEGLKETKVENSIIVMGGVNYDNIPIIKDSIIEPNSEDLAMTENISRSSVRLSKLEYLPGTKQEIENLQQILGNKKWLVKTYSDNNASENNFKSELNYRNCSVLHIATHGFAFTDLFVKNKSQFEDDYRPYRDSDNPMARCGLLLAGANNSWLGNADTMLSKTGEDGILSALEVSQLNLRKTKLVVLSACETGLGKIDGSEGTFGLKRAFKMAGVEQIIVSLWSVPDRETTELMTLFYNDLSVTLSPVRSFEKAQKEMREKYPSEPEKWAGFVLVR